MKRLRASQYKVIGGTFIKVDIQKNKVYTIYKLVEHLLNASNFEYRNH